MKTILVMVTMMAAQGAMAMDVGQEIRAQGQAAMTSIQAELRASLARPAAEPAAEPADASHNPVAAAIRAQSQFAMRTIAWENEATLHTSTLAAGPRGTSQHAGIVAVSAPYFESVGAESN